MPSQTKFVALDYRFDDPCHDQPTNACNVCHYHLLLCGHTIRTPLVDNCGYNCVDALPASLEYPAFACSKCHEDKIEKTDIAFSARTKKLAGKIAKGDKSLDPCKLCELAREWDEALAEAHTEFDGRRKCEAVEIGNLRECGDNVTVVGLKSVGRSARKVDRSSNKSGSEGLHNLLSGLAISNEADLDLAEVLSQLKLSTRGGRDGGGNSTGRDRSRSPNRQASTSLGRYRERYLSPQRRAAKPCRATPRYSAIVPSRALSSETEDLPWETYSPEYHADPLHYNNMVVEYDIGPETRALTAALDEASSENAVSKAFEVWSTLAHRIIAENPTPRPASMQKSWVPDADDVYLGRVEHLAIDVPELVEAESDSSIGPWLVKTHGPNDVSENHNHWRHESELLPTERRGAVDFGRLGNDTQEDGGETLRIPGLAMGMKGEEGREEEL